MHDNISMAFAIEGMACLQAIQLRLDLQLLVVEIKGDAHLVVRKVQKEEDRSEIGPYIVKFKCLFVGYHSYFSRYTSRQSNGVAHILATERLKREENTYLTNWVPPNAAEEVKTDQSWVEIIYVAEGSLNICL